MKNNNDQNDNINQVNVKESHLKPIDNPPIIIKDRPLRNTLTWIIVGFILILLLIVAILITLYRRANPSLYPEQNETLPGIFFLIIAICSFFFGAYLRSRPREIRIDDNCICFIKGNKIIWTVPWNHIQRIITNSPKKERPQFLGLKIITNYSTIRMNTGWDFNEKPGLQQVFNIIVKRMAGTPILIENYAGWVVDVD